jgi:hypothetical protein
MDHDLSLNSVVIICFRSTHLATDDDHIRRVETWVLDSDNSKFRTQDIQLSFEPNYRRFTED